MTLTTVFYVSYSLTAQADIFVGPAEQIRFPQNALSPDLMSHSTSSPLLAESADGCIPGQN